jgi:hypothetical protein
MELNFWFVVRVLALVAFLLFVAVLLMFVLEPANFGGSAIADSSSLWFALSIAFMATVSSLSLFLVLDPKKFWYFMVPLVVGKATSSLTSLVLISRHYSAPFLQMNMLGDGLIAVIFLILLFLAYKKIKVW